MSANTSPWRGGIHLLRRAAAVWRLLLRNIGRAYALGLMVLIGTLTVMAVHYLLTSLAAGSRPPQQITNLPARLTPEVLQVDWTAWQALRATPFARSPLAHYHRVGEWMEPDAFNDCTRSGCHAALPHARRKEVRAFLNMHATSIHCGVCHMNVTDQPLPLVWYDLKTGRRCDRPPLLAAFELLTSPSKRVQLLHATPAEQRQLVDLLRAAARAAQGATSLEELADHFEAIRPGSDAFEKLVGEAQKSLPDHFRGEYGEKLAVRMDGADGGPRLGHPNTQAAVEEWLDHGTSLGADDRARLLAAVHPLKRSQPRHCTDCHTAQGSLIDFARLGYPEARREMLTTPIIFRMIEHINAGQPLHMPEITMPTRSDQPAYPPG